MLQRQVVSDLEIDTPMLSKIERGERNVKREQVLLFAKIYNADKDELLTLWLADQVFKVIEGESIALKALELVKSRLKK